MPLTGLANAAIDRVAPDPAGLRGAASRVYGESDLLCYRAEGPARLVARQAELWDPILAWARRRYDVEFEGGDAASSTAPAGGDGRAARPGGRGARPVRAGRPVAAGDDHRLAGHRAGAGRGRDRRSSRPGPRPRSTSNGRPSNGARMPRPPPRSPPAAATSRPARASSALALDGSRWTIRSARRRARRAARGRNQATIRPPSASASASATKR